MCNKTCLSLSTKYLVWTYYNTVARFTSGIAIGNFGMTLESKEKGEEPGVGTGGNEKICEKGM